MMTNIHPELCVCVFVFVKITNFVNCWHYQMKQKKTINFPKHLSWSLLAV